MFLVFYFIFILIVYFFSLLAISSFGTLFDPQYEPALAFFSGLFMLFFYDPYIGRRPITWSRIDRNLINTDNDLQSVIVGFMLGDGYADRRANTRIQISQSDKHYAYVEYLFHFFAERGLCNPIFTPLTASVRNDTILYSIRFYTYTYPEFYWVHNAFYTDGQGNRVTKHVPLNVSELLTPLALAIWIADDGG